MSHAVLDSAASLLHTYAARRAHPADGRLPLAGLRMRLDDASRGVQWTMHPDGVLGRALMMPAPATVTVPLRLEAEVSFSARVMLLPHDWRDGRGAVTARVAVEAPDGRRVQLWSGMLRSAQRRGRPRGHKVSCRLPAWSTSLQLTLDPGRHQQRAVARGIWLEPVLIDPSVAPSAIAQPHPIQSSPPPPLQTPLISVLTPVHNPPLPMLEEAIASVREQTFTGWELCLVDDGSTDPEIIAALERHADADPRIHLTRREQAGGISTATNTALNMATGAYVALLDHDDTLTPDALQHVAHTIAAQPDLDMIYSDEDVVSAGRPPSRHLKPGWSPETMATLMYTCHVGVYRRSLALDLGGFQSRFDGCQDYDFVLRLAERTDRIAHIPRILYHWRAHLASTAGGDAKPYAYIRQPLAIAEHMQRRNVAADIHFAHLPGVHRVVHRVSASAAVAIALAIDDEHDEQGLTPAALSWLSQPHPNWNLTLAAPAHLLATATDTLTNAGLDPSRLTTVAVDPTTPRADALATAAHSADPDAQHLLLMQTPAMGLTHDWLTRLIGYSSQTDIGAAGPVVLAPDGRIQDAGVALPDGIPLVLHQGAGASGGTPAVANVTAVSGVVMTRRAVYQQLGGLDSQYGDLAPVEYCLRAIQANLRIVIVPDARLRTTTPDRITNDLPAIFKLRDHWARTHTHDPYYNPNYRTDRGDFIPLPV